MFFVVSPHSLLSAVCICIRWPTLSRYLWCSLNDIVLCSLWIGHRVTLCRKWANNYVQFSAESCDGWPSLWYKTFCAAAWDQCIMYVLHKHVEYTAQTAPLQHHRRRSAIRWTSSVTVYILLWSLDLSNFPRYRSLLCRMEAQKHKVIGLSLFRVHGVVTMRRKKSRFADG